MAKIGFCLEIGCLTANLGSSIIIPNIISIENLRSKYKIAPQKKDQGILIICRNGLYLICEGVSNGRINNAILHTVFHYSGKKEPEMSFDDNYIYLTFDIYEAPTFIGRF